MVEFWPVELVDGTVVSAEPALTTISSYVLIEQEDWFEKEIGFVRRLLQPGMCAIDIGANVGVYTLVMARLVGPAGRVLAVEPLRGPRRHLERSLGLNGLANVAVHAVAVADEAGVGRMHLGTGTEMASLHGSDTSGEEVEVTTLDRLAASLAMAPDFIKIDAEGAERLVLVGGRECLARHAPLLMIEVRTDEAVKEPLLKDLQALGFDLYRALPHAQGLVPYVIGSPLDTYELNLFACRQDRAEDLERRGLLARDDGGWQSADAPSADAAIAAIGRHAFAAGFAGLFVPAAIRPGGYGDALRAWAVWTAPDHPLSRRHAALRHAYDCLADIVRVEPTLPRLVTLMRVAAAAGQRGVVVDIAGTLFERASQPVLQLDEPFLPPHPRYDAIAPSADVRQWLLAAAGEQYEQSRAFSSIYAPFWPGVHGICATGHASSEMFRRLALKGTIEQIENAFDGRLLRPAPDHRNAALWQALIARQVIRQPAMRQV